MAASRRAKPTAAAKKTAPAAKTPAPVRDVDAVLRELKRNASAKFRADMSARYGIVTRDETFGTPMAKIKAIAKPLGKDHAFAEALWRTGVYEARILVSMVGEPERLTPAQRDRWAIGRPDGAVDRQGCSARVREG